MNKLFLIALGLSGGAIVGTGISAFITVLGVVVTSYGFKQDSKIWLCI